MNLRKNKNIILIAIGVILVIAIIMAIVLVLTKKEPVDDLEEEINVEQLEMQFNDIFDNAENEYISTLYNIQEEKSGKYKIEVVIPYTHISAEIDNKINKEINDIFVNKLLKIINQNQSYNIIKINYTTSINKGIISLMIKCVLKEGSNAQRTIIKTYNYNIENNTEVKIMDLIPDENKETIQNNINKKIQSEIKEKKQ